MNTVRSLSSFRDKTFSDENKLLLHSVTNNKSNIEIKIYITYCSAKSNIMSHYVREQLLFTNITCFT